MSDDLFSGKWIGEYKYGSDYPALERKAPVSFEMEITVQGGVMKGTCVDEETKTNFDKPAIIEGTISDNQVNFKKIYPHFWDHDDNNKPRFIPKLPARELSYTGRFENGKFAGEWQISSVFTDETGEVFEYGGRGSWQMQKAG